MKAWLDNRDYYSVFVTEDDVREFASRWPASGLDADAAYEFQYSAANGDLVDITVIRDGKPASPDESDDGPAHVALAEDAGRYGAETLGLAEVIAIRWPGAPKP